MPWNDCGKQEQLYIDGGLAPVPEPATMGLMAIGLVAMPGLGSAAAAAAGIVRRPSSIHGGWKGAGKCRRPFYVRRRVVRAGPIHDR